MGGKRLEDRMWVEAIAMLERAEHLQQRFFEPTGRRACWQPPADIYETEQDLWIVIALPGVPAEALTVVLRGHWLEVRGTRPLAEEARLGLIHRLELPYGDFQRRLELPARHYVLEGQRLVDGCLYLRLGKR